MTLEEAQKLIPNEFRIGGQTIKVLIKEKGEDFGTFSSLRNTITVYLSIKDDDDGSYVIQTKEQLLNTYYHELFHCFNFLYNTEMDEGLAQSFSNLFCEYLETVKHGNV